MRQDRRFQRNRKAEEEQRRLLMMAVIPLTVIVLMIIIVIADHWKAKNQEETYGESFSAEQMGPNGETCVDDPDGIIDGGGNSDVPESESMEPEMPAEALGEFETEELRQDSVLEILDLMKTYFKARESSDAETMNRLYGIGEVSEAQLEEERMRLRSNAKYVLGFDDITTYVMAGEPADSWLVYTLYDIKFHSVNTEAPMIMWSFVKKDAEGNYLLVNTADLTESMLEFADRANHSEGVRRLASSVNVRLKEALDADADLNEVYGVLRDGSPVYGVEEEPEVVVVEETTAAPETTSSQPRETRQETTAADETTAAAPSAEASETIAAFQESTAAPTPETNAEGPAGAIEAGPQNR